MKIAVIGATGTAGSRTVLKLKSRDVAVVEVSRSSGVNLISGSGLHEALEGVDVVIDTSNPFPADETIGLREALTAATRNVVDACSSQQIEHLVFMSISGIENPVFDAFDYYVAKRAQEKIVGNSPVPSTIVKSTQWHEFATNPAAVTFQDDQVLVEDWLIQPVAADTVADVLIDAALGDASTTTRTITGPEAVRLPELTTKLLSQQGDPRPVRSIPPAVADLAEGVLLAPSQAIVVGPDVDTWLQTLASAD